MSAAALPFLAGGGEVGHLLRGGAVEGSAFGDAADWPVPLRTLVGVMLTAASPMFVVWGTRRALLYNDAYAPILGARHPAALGRSFYEVWHEVQDELRPILENAYAGRSTSMDDIELVLRRNGHAETTHFSFFYAPVWDEAGEVAGVVCACNEITQKVQERRQVTSELQRQSRLFQAAPGFIAVLSGPEHVFEFTNAAYNRLIGNRAAVGKPMRAVLPEIERQRFLDLLDTVYASGERYVAQRMPVSLEQAAGTPLREVYVDFVYEPIIDADGRVTGIFVEGSDVTAMRDAEVALRELNETLESKVAERTAERDTMWRLSKDLLAVFGRDGVLRAVNPAWRSLLGFEPDELVGHPVGDFMHPDDVERMLHRVLADAQPEPFVNRHRHRDGSHRWIAWTAVPQGGAVYAVGRDVTAERRAAQQLEQIQTRLHHAQKMEALGQLTGGIAHDFNNLLQALRNHFELLRRQPADVERVEQRAESGLRMIERGARLTSQLLTFSSTQRLDGKPVDLRQLLDGMTELLARTLGSSITVDLRFDDAADRVIADPVQLEMALINLAVNARDAMPGGGRLTVAAAPRRIGDHADVAPGEYIELSIEDEGPGMPADVRERAFEPFYTTKTVGKGTGLGLAQVYGFARGVGGSACIETRAGHGTRVALLLRRAAAPAPPAARHDAEPTTAAEVLLIDDDGDVRSVLAEFLRSSGYRVREAADGRSGLAALQHGRPDVVVLDYAMPEMNGAEVARAVRQRHAQLPIIFASGYADSAEMQAALGPDAVTLRKPFELTELIAAIEQAVTA